MLRARGASRMPPDRPLPEADMRLVERWILDGAPRYIGGPPMPVPPVPDAGAGTPVPDAGTGRRAMAGWRRGRGDGGCCCWA